MFYNDFWKYLFISYFYGINPAQAENPVFVFYYFRDPNVNEKSWKFTGVNIWKEEDLWAKEASKRRPEAQKRGAHAATVPGHVGPIRLALVALLPSIFPPPTPS